MKTFRIFTLGCRCNQYESQKYFDQLIFHGWREDIRRPKLIIINSCCVTQKAEKKSCQLMKQLRSKYPDAQIFFIGCAVNFCQDREVGVVFVENKKKEDFLFNFGLIKNIPFDGIENFQRHTRAFVKIQDGCDQFCSYCIIPYLRGRSRSRNICDIYHEVQRLVENGYKEVILTGIDLGDFQPHLCDLLEKLENIEKLKRIRLSSIDPKDVDERLIYHMEKSEKMVHSMHLSLQSGSDRILKKMRRRYTKKYFLDLIEKLQKKRSDMTFSTDIIVGFPTETEEDCDQSLKVIKKVRFLKVHIFPFSRRSKTKANNFPNQIEKKDLLKRKKMLENQAEETSFFLRKEFLGKEMEVLLENEYDISGKYIRGITRNGLLVFVKNQELNPNDLIRVRMIKNTKEHLFAEEIGKKNEN